MARRRKSPNEDDHTGAIWADFARVRRQRLNMDLLWYVLMEQYKGNPEVFYEPPNRGQGAQIYRLPVGGQRSQKIRPLNNIGHAIDILVAKQMKPRPVWSTSPASMEEKDKLSARAARDLLRHLWDVNRMASRRRELYLHRNILGNGFVMVQFNPLKGPFKDDPQMDTCPRCMGSGYEAFSVEASFMGGMNPETGEPPPCQSCNGQKQIVTEVKRKAMGDVEFSIVSPWEIYPDLAATCVEDAQYIYRAYKVPTATAEARFPWMKDHGGIGPSRVLEDAESQFAQLARNYRFEEPDDSAWIVEKHMPPLPGEEQPRIAIMAGDRVAWPRPDDKQGLKNGWKKRRERMERIPLFHFTARPSPENFWAQGHVIDMITSNDTVNRGRDLQHRHMVSMSQPKWFLERGAVRSQALTTEVGEVVEYEPGSERPFSDRPAPLSEFNERLIERENNRVYEIAGVNEIDRGIAPKNIEAAEALEILVEQSGTTHGPIILRDSETWADIGMAALHTAKANYDPQDKRVVQVTGSGTEAEVKAFEAADLNTKVSVRVTVGSALHQNLALKRNHLLGLWDRQIVTDPREILEEMEFGVGAADYSSDRRLQESVAMAENEAIVSGQPHQILQHTHDHEVHMACHRKAALEAQSRGDMQAAQMLSQAVSEHAMQLQPQAPAGGPAPAGGQPEPAPDEMPFDTAPPEGAYTEGQ